MKQRNSDMDRKKTNRHKAHDKRRVLLYLLLSELLPDTC